MKNTATTRMTQEEFMEVFLNSALDFTEAEGTCTIHDNPTPGCMTVLLKTASAIERAREAGYEIRFDAADECARCEAAREVQYDGENLCRACRDEVVAELNNR